METLRWREEGFAGARAATVVAMLALAACDTDRPAQVAGAAPAEWREFRGSWSAAGTIHSIPLGSQRKASLADLRGTLILSGPSRPGVGFRSDALALADSETGMVGRAVWTDDRGDQVFSELRGAGPVKGGRVSGTFVGGTGQYAGATGTYEFTWQYVLAAEDGTVHGQAMDLHGRVRAGGSAGSGDARGGRP